MTARESCPIKKYYQKNSYPLARKMVILTLRTKGRLRKGGVTLAHLSARQ
jgi:hypothetical protein